MARNRKLKPWEQEIANARKAREDGFEASIQANPELYRKLKDKVDETRDACWEIDKLYRSLSMAQSEASNLRHTLKDCGLDAEAAIATGLLAMVEKAIQPLLEPQRNADNAHELAKKAIEEQFSTTEEPA